MSLGTQEGKKFICSAYTNTGTEQKAVGPVEIMAVRVGQRMVCDFRFTFLRMPRHAMNHQANTENP